jgi:cytochrome c551/c552
MVQSARPEDRIKRRLIFAVQVASFSLIWLFVVGIALWIINLMRLSVELDDAVGATAAISLIAIPVFFTLAGILTYVFVGLQKEEKRVESERGSKSVTLTLVVLAVGGVAPVASLAQAVDLPSDILAGRIVFEEKGCIGCHGLGGFGGTDAPDLAADHYYGSFMELAADVWNHVPQMYRKLRRERRDPPKLTYQETLDLFAFLYSLRYLGEPGSVARGRRLLESKGCVRCHSLSGQQRVGPDLSAMHEYASPIFMSQTMWNHVPDMVESIEAENVAYPLLTGQDITDITAFVTAGFQAGSVHRMSAGNPNRGREIFQEKGCKSCHAPAAGIGPDLSASTARKSVSEIAALMWNHGPEMAEFVDAEGMEWPEFAGTDMADLIAYIYFLGFEDPPGDAAEGREVLERRGCVACHRDDAEGIAPPFDSIGRLRSSISMIRLMWNHAPSMEEKLLIRNEEWPKLSKKDMQDVYAYLLLANESSRGVPAHRRERRP